MGTITIRCWQRTLICTVHYIFIDRSDQMQNGAAITAHGSLNPMLELLFSVDSVESLHWFIVSTSKHSLFLFFDEIILVATPLTVKFCVNTCFYSDDKCLRCMQPKVIISPGEQRRTDMAYCSTWANALYNFGLPIFDRRHMLSLAESKTSKCFRSCWLRISYTSLRLDWRYSDKHNTRVGKLCFIIDIIIMVIVLVYCRCNWYDNNRAFITHHYWPDVTYMMPLFLDYDNGSVSILG
jgi:hypothetical protein